MGTMFRLCFLLFLLFFPSFALSELCNPHDKQVLLQIKKHFNDPYVLISWKSDTDCCISWNCVTCDPKTNRINSLNVITDNNIAGTIPPGVGDLPYLETLEFHKLPKLTGPIHPTIAKLTNLKELYLSWNNLTGPVPSFLALLTNLQIVDLSFNSFSGPIPSSLSQLPNLFSLRLDRNKLTGSIPDSFGFFKNPGIGLVLSHNQLSGPTPNSLAHINPERIDLSKNKLEGDASMLFGSNKTTQIVDVSRNLLAFDLSKVEFSTSLISIDLNHNKIYGSIPVGLTAVDFLQGFNVSYNRLCGEIPQGGRLQRFEVDSYFHNKWIFCSGFNVSYNRLCGEIPQGGRLQRFEVDSYFHNKCLCGSPLPNCK